MRSIFEGREKVRKLSVDAMQIADKKSASIAKMPMGQVAATRDARKTQTIPEEGSEKRAHLTKTKITRKRKHFTKKSTKNIIEKSKSNIGIKIRSNKIQIN